MKKLFIIVLIFIGAYANAQQDPQYTQYMYNTQIINPGYAGSAEALSFGLLYRTQWVGFEGAPQTGTFTVHSPVGEANRMGLGLGIVHDQIGPATESNVTVDYSYSLVFRDYSRLSFGLKAGVDLLNVDYTKLNIYDGNDPNFAENVDNKLQPQVGAGAYYYTDRFYAGVSVPNFFNSKHYDAGDEGVDDDKIAAERLHYFFIAGYVFDINENVKFKPATLVKAVSGSPLQADVSANFLFNDKFTLGAAYRWSAAFSAMAGFQISDQLFAGVGYDLQTTKIENYSSGSYEVFLRFDLSKLTERILTPRFF